MNRTFKFTAGVIMLVCACLIYITWRSERINLNLWGENFGLAPVIDFLRTNVGRFNPGTFVKSSLPDGLFCAAYILVMDSVWENNRNSIRISMALLIPALAIIHESMQYFNLVAGTFDLRDILCYFVPALTYIIIVQSNH